MKNGGQRIAIDFTLSEDMSNKVSTLFFQFCMKPELVFFWFCLLVFFTSVKNFMEFFLARVKVSLFLCEIILQRSFQDHSFCLLHLSKNLEVANPVGNAHAGQHS